MYPPSQWTCSDRTANCSKIKRTLSMSMNRISDFSKILPRLIRHIYPLENDLSILLIIINASDCCEHHRKGNRSSQYENRREYEWSLQISISLLKVNRRRLVFTWKLNKLKFERIVWDFAATKLFKHITIIEYFLKSSNDVANFIFVIQHSAETEECWEHTHRLSTGI